MPSAIVAPNEDLLAGLAGRLPRPRLPPAYALGLATVSATMIVLPMIYVAIVLTAAAAVVWWAVEGLGILASGSVGTIKIRLFLYLAPLLAGGSLAVFLVKPLFSRVRRLSDDLCISRRDQPLFIAFIERLAAFVGAPIPDRVVIDCQVNAGAGLDLRLLRREGSALVLCVGLPLVTGLTFSQFAGVLAHEFGHFGQGVGMRLGQLISRVNAWFERVVYERDSWDEASRVLRSTIHLESVGARVRQVQAFAAAAGGDQTDGSVG